MCICINLFRFVFLIVNKIHARVILNFMLQYLRMDHFPILITT